MNRSIKTDLAAAYQILSALGLDDHTYTHLSARSAEGDAFYIQPFGLRFEEVTADLLMKVSLEGDVQEGQEYDYNRTGYIIHGTLYEARPELRAVFHLHTPAIVAVSAMREGLLPASQWALHFYDHIAYHDYDSLALIPDQGRRLVADLGTHKTMLLRHHGSLTCGHTIQEAMFYSYHLEQACKTQVQLLSMGREMILPPKQTCEKSVHDLLGFEPNLGARDWAAWLRMIARQ